MCEVNTYLPVPGFCGLIKNERRPLVSTIPEGVLLIVRVREA